MFLGLLLTAGGLPACAPQGDAPASEEAAWDAGVCRGVSAAPRQIRLLTRREYDHSVRDLLGLALDVPCTDDTACALDLQSCSDGVCTDDPCDTHTFTLAWGDAASLHVAGSFNGWPDTPAQGESMRRVPGEDIWYAKVSLPEGDHQYKFVVDGSQWVTDPSNPRTVDDTFGGQNSLLTIACDGASALSGPDRPSDPIPPETRPPHWHYDNQAAAGVVTANHLEAYLTAAASLAEAARSQLDRLVPCDRTDPACVRDTLGDLASRAWRRPLEEGERDALVALAEGQAGVDDGLQLALEAILTSPHFLYRTELGEVQGDEAVLTDHELAAAMSYFLWGTAPDDALRAAADRGELSQPSHRAEHARRMLDDPRARDTFATFTTQWLGVERVLTTDKSPALYPDFTASVRRAALDETRRFATHVAFDSSGTWDELLTSTTHFVDGALAPLYGLEAPAGEGLVAVQGDGRRPGVLGQVSVMAATAHSDQTSPVRRGLFVRERLLCDTFGAPPPEAGGVPDVDPDATTRERFDQHSADPVCASCHRYIDPVGYGFEHLDAVGAWRDTESGRPIDATGSLLDVERDGGGPGAFTDLSGLAAHLVASERGPACFTRELYRFATGFEAVEDDCALQALTERFARSGHDIRDLMVAIVSSDTFAHRHATAEEAP